MNVAAKVEAVIIDIVGKKSLKFALQDQGLSAYHFYNHINNTPAALSNYALAQKARSEQLVEEIIEIADNELDPHRARIMVDARKWYASKMVPHKYGDKLDINLTGAVDVRAAITEARKRALPDSCQSNEVEVNGIDITKVIANGHTDMESVEQDAEDNLPQTIEDLLA